MSEHRGRIKGIFLDFDGTIVDSSEAYVEAARIACERIGCVALDRKAALEIPKRMELKLPLRGIPQADVSRFLDVYLKTFYETSMEKSRPFYCVDEALLKLSQKAKLALVTMRFISGTAVAKQLRYFGLDKYFTYVATSLDTPKPKPSPEILVKSAEHLNVRLSDCMVVGDSISDIRAGKAVGVTTVSVLSGLFSRGELVREAPDLILDNVNELPRHVDFLE